MDTLFTTLYVLIDDWYQAQGRLHLVGKAGAKPSFSDSELQTLLLAHDFVPFPSETQYVAYIRANYLGMFPKLVDQSQFNRRGRALQHVVFVAFRCVHTTILAFSSNCITSNDHELTAFLSTWH